jgi:hypothetical protein
MDTMQITRREFWTTFAPTLHIEDHPGLKNLSVPAITPEQQQVMLSLLKEEGYLQAGLQWGVALNVMADRVRALSAANLSPVFSFIYDEFWMPFYQLHNIYSGLLGGKYYISPDFWVWNVDPRKGESGWRPHRDKGKRSLLPDGGPKSLTTWIPLSTATPLNGCVYIVPAMCDPTYGTDDENTWKFEYSSIRALPANPGDFFIWNQAVLHWGSRTSPRAPESRVSMAFEVQRSDVEAFNEPLIKPFSIVPFEGRLKLIAKQLLQYRHMYRIEPQIEQIATELIAA